MTSLVVFALSLLLVAAVAVGVIFYTSTGASLILRAAVNAYDKSIPADITMQKVNGTIATGIEVSGISIRDRNRSPMIEIDSLRLDISPWELIEKKVHLRNITIDTGTVYIENKNSRITLSDLTPPSSEPKSNEPEDIIDSLPVTLQFDKTALKQIHLIHVNHKTNTLLALLQQGEFGLTWSDFLKVSLTRLDATVYRTKQPIRVSLRRPQQLHVFTDKPTTRFDISSEWGDIHLNVEWKITRGIEARIQTDISVPSLAAIDAGLSGKAIVYGDTQFSVQPEHGLTASADLTCTDCRLAPFGDIQLNVKAQLQRDRVQATVSATTPQFTVSAAYRGDTAGAGSLNSELSGSLPSEIPAHFDVDAEIEKLTLKSDCSTTAMPTRCDMMLTSTNTRYNDIHVTELAVEGAAVLIAPYFTTAKFHARQGRIGDTAFRALTLDAHTEEDSIAVRATLDKSRGEQANVTGTVRLHDDIRVSVSEFSSSLFGVSATTITPLEAQIDDRDIRLLQPVEIDVNQALVRITRLTKSDQGIDAHADIQALPLQPFSPLAKRELNGSLTASIDIGGTAQKPVVSAQTSAISLAVDGVPLGDMQLKAQYAENMLNAEVTGSRAHGPWLHATAEVPLQLNLTTGAATQSRNSLAVIEWDTLQITDAFVRSQFAIPDDFHFSAGSTGKLTLNNGSPILNATLGGTLTHPLSETVQFESTVSIDSTGERISLNLTDGHGTPVQLTASADILYARLRRNKFPQGNISFQTTIADSRIDGDIELHSAEEIDMDLELSNVHTDYLRPYFPQAALDATLEGTLALVIDPVHKKVRPMDGESWKLSWRLNHITSEQAAEFIKLPPQILFDVSYQGTLRAQSGHLSADGKINGWAGPSKLLPFPVSLTHRIAETRQHISAEWMMPNAVPVTLSFSSAIQVWEALEARKLDSDFQGEVRWGDISLRTDGHFADVKNFNVHTNFSGINPLLLEPYLNLGGIQAEVGGRAQLTMAAGIATGDTAVTALNIVGEGFAISRVETNAEYRNNRLYASVLARHTAGEEIRLTADVPISLNTDTLQMQWNQNGTHHIEWRASKMSLYPYRKLLHIPDAFDITMSTEGSIDGNSNSYKMAAAAQGFIRVPGRERVPYDIRFNAVPNRVTASADIHFSKETASRMELESRPNLQLLLKGKQSASDLIFSGKLRSGDFDLQFIELLPLFGIAAPKGIAVMNVDFNGSINNPKIRGDVQIRDGQFTARGLGNRIHHVQGNLQLVGPILKIRKLTFMSGKGKARLWGRLEMNNGVLRGWNKFNAVRFPISLAGLPKFELDASAYTTLRLKEGTLTVDSTLKKTQFTKPAKVRTAAKIIPSNDNVRVQQKEDDTAKAAQGIDFNISIHNDKPIAVRGRDMDTYWNTELSVVREDGAIRVSGNIDAVRGSFNLLQNIFKIEKGQLTLAPVPGKGAYLQLSSVGSVSAYTVYLTVSGNLLRPQLKLTSSPSLTEEQILSLLISGSTQENAEKSTGAITTLLALQYPEVHNLLYERFGINQLKLETTQQGSTTLKAGKRVGKRSTVYTVVNPNPAKNENDVELQVETAITDKTTVGTGVGQKSSSLGIYRKISIPNDTDDGKKPPPQK